MRAFSTSERNAVVDTVTKAIFVGSATEARTFLGGTPKHYVYVLRRPDRRPFYVGKGVRGRLFHHENDARHDGNHPKLNVIRAIWRCRGDVQYEIDSLHDTAEEAYAREAELISAIKRHHEGGPLTNLAAGGGTDAGPSPLSIEKHRISLGGVPEHDPEKAAVNRYFLAIGQPKSICVKIENRFKARSTQVHPSKKIGQSARQAYALVTSAVANGIFLVAGCRIPRRLSIDGICALIENGVSRDLVTSGMAILVAAADPRDECFELDERQVRAVVGFLGQRKLRDLGILVERPNVAGRDAASTVSAPWHRT